MSPLYVDARRMFGDNPAEPGDEIVDFRAHLKKQRGPAVRSVGSGLAASVRGLALRLSPPAPVDLEPMPEDTFGSGWTPGTGINEEA